MDNTHSNKWANIALFIGAAAILIWLLSSVAVSLAGAWLLAYLLTPLVARLTQQGMSRQKACSLVLLGSVAIVILAIVLVIPVIANQSLLFVSALPDALNRLQTEWLPMISQYLGIAIPVASDELMSSLSDRLRHMDWKAFSPWANMGVSAATGVIGSIAAIFKLLLIPMFASYLLHDWEKITKMIHDHIPNNGKVTILRLLHDMDSIISVFLRGQFAICAILACCYSTGLLIAGIPFAIIIGLLAGFLGFIPYVGYLTGMIAALLISLWSFGADVHLLYVVIIFVGTHLLEGFYLVPNVLGSKLGLHPLVLLMALIIAASHFGFVGLLLAVPVTAAGAVLIREVDRRYLSSTIIVPDGSKK